MKPRLASDIVERYEVLRDHLVHRRWSQAHSWRVVVQHGVLAWSQLPPSRPPLLRPQPLHRDAVPVALQALVTHALASMVLHLHPEVSHDD